MALTKAHNRMIADSAINVKDFGAVGDGVNDDTAAIQAAIDAAEDNNGDLVFIPAGIYLVTSPIKLKSSVTLEGVSWGNYQSNTRNGSTLKVGANLSNVLYTEQADNAQNITLSRFHIDGSSGTYTVTNAIELYGIQIKLDSMKIARVTGNGVRFHETGGGLFTWVNRVQDCLFTEIGGYGLYNQSSDSFFTNNYFTNCDQGVLSEISGGNIWQGNHFDHTTAGYAGLKILRNASYSAVGDRIIGNYFDVNDIGLHIDADLQKDATIISGNRFRAQSTYDIHLESTSYISVKNCQFTYASQTAAIRFTGGSGPLIHGCEFDSTYTTLFSGAPLDMRVVDMQYGGTGSNRGGTATVLNGNSSVTVTHNLYDTPKYVVVTTSTNTKYAAVTNKTSTTFDINLNSAVTANHIVNWYASVTI